MLKKQLSYFNWIGDYKMTSRWAIVVIYVMLLQRLMGSLFFFFLFLNICSNNVNVDPFTKGSWQMAVHLLALYHKSVRLVSIISYCLISSDICWLNKINIRLTLHIAWIQSKLIFFVSNSEINVNANKSNEFKKIIIIKSPTTTVTERSHALSVRKQKLYLPVLLLLMVLWITFITNIS